MNPKELLDSLSRLEAELQDVASARALVEQNTQSYRDIQSEIRDLIREFQNIINAVNSIANSFETGKKTLSAETAQATALVKTRLLSINDAFGSNCKNIAEELSNRLEEVINSFSSANQALTASLAQNNADFKERIEHLGKYHSSFVKATASLSSLKHDIEGLLGQLNDSHKELQAAIDKIADTLQSLGTQHTDILNGISNNVRKILNLQNLQLSSIKIQLDNINNTLPQLQKNTSEQLNKLHNDIDTRLNAVDLKTKQISEATKMLKILGIVNTIAIVVLLVLHFVP